MLEPELQIALCHRILKQFLGNHRRHYYQSMISAGDVSMP
jgi:hypothetical protein